MSNKLKLGVLLVLIVAIVGGSFVYFSRNKVLSSGESIYGTYLGKVLKNDKVVATVNGYPIYLSDVAIPYFSESVSFLKTKNYLKSVASDPKMSDNVKKQALSDLKNIPDPIKILQARINNALLYEELKKNGKLPTEEQVNDEMNKLSSLWEYNLKHYPNSSWSKFFVSLKKALGVKNNEELLRYYRRLRITDDAYKYFVDRFMALAPEPDETEINAEMKTKNIPKDLAIQNLKGRYVKQKLDALLSKLKENANIKIIDAKAVKNLSSYFGK